LAWWDGVELWLVQLWFPIQFAVVMGVVLPACWFGAWLMDRGWGRGSRFEDAVPPDAVPPVAVASQDVASGVGVACADRPT
jgi:hypothetical protein